MGLQLTKSFTLEELTISQEAIRSGLKNKPTDDQINNLRLLCEHVLQPLRDSLRRPIIVTSGFRSVTINRRIGGSQSSQHCKGQAADIIVPGMSVADVVARIKRLRLPVDQCINEFSSWTHVSYGARHRRQFLKVIRENGNVVYKPL